MAAAKSSHRDALSVKPVGWLDMFWRPFLDPVSCLPKPKDKPENLTAAELLRQLRLSLRQRLKESRGGVRRSVSRGQGDDFAELREYCPGDDIRKMDWNVLARTTIPHIREYHADRQRTWWFVLDCTASMQFGQKRSKIDHLLSLAGYLGLMAQQEGCRVGGVIIADLAAASSLHVIPPAQGEANLQRILAEVLKEVDKEVSGPTPVRPLEAQQDPLTIACERLGALIARSATVFFLSDFLAWSNQGDSSLKVEIGTDPFPEWKKRLGQLASKTDVIAVPIWDVVELRLPCGVGSVPVIDPETGEVSVLDTNSADFRFLYEHALSAEHERLLSWLSSIGQVIQAPTATDPLDCLLGRIQSGNVSTTWGRALL